MIKIIVKLSLIVFLISSVAFSMQAQGFALEVTSVQEMEIDTITGDTIYSDALYGPSTIQLALDSLNSPYRVVLPDSIDKDSLKITLAPILLNKVRIENGILVTDAVKADFASLGLPDVVYNYFLQEITDYNAGNRLRQMSAKEIEENFLNIQSKLRERKKEEDLQKRRQDLFNNKKELFNYSEEIENNRDLNSEETESLRAIYELVSDKLQLVDGKLTADIPENKELDDFSRKCIQYLQFIIELTNIDLEIKESSIESREDMKEWLKNDMKNYAKNIEEHQNK